MAETLTESAPVAQPEQLTLEQELQAFKDSLEKPATPAPETKPAETLGEFANNTVTGEQKGIELNPEPTELEKKLEAIETPKAEESKPQLSDDQQKILSQFTTPQAAEQAAQLASGYQNFTNAFAGGDFDSVQNMLETWNPAATEAFYEHIYQSKVASGEWVDRWIADKEGNPTVHRGMKALEAQIQDLKRQLQGQTQERQTQAERQRQEQVGQAYMNHIDGLFKKIDFSEADRRWVLADIHNRVAADNQVRQKIYGGDPSAVNAIFKQAVRDYVQRDQKTTENKEAVRKLQEQKKPLLQTSPVATENALPSNVRDVPKGKEEEWMDQELTNLFASVKRK